MELDQVTLLVTTILAGVTLLSPRTAHNCGSSVISARYLRLLVVPLYGTMRAIWVGMNAIETATFAQFAARNPLRATHNAFLLALTVARHRSTTLAAQWAAQDARKALDATTRAQVFENLTQAVGARLSEAHAAQPGCISSIVEDRSADGEGFAVVTRWVKAA